MIRHPARLVVATLVSTALSCATVQAQGEPDVLKSFFDRYDHDSDGRIDREEFPGSDAQFKDLDADASGRVDLEEFGESALARRLLVARRKDAEAPRARVELEAIAWKRLDAAMRFDVNKNGRVEREEWRGAPTAFDEIDLDRDGDLDPSDAAIAQRFAEAEPLEPRLPNLRKRLDRVDDLTRKLDDDHDGQLQRREVRGHVLATAFDWADRNGDEALDVDELRRLDRAVAERIARRNQGGSRIRAYRVPFTTWDDNDDDRLEPGEWQQRGYLFGRIDQDRDAAVTRDEVARYVRSVEGTTFVERFDLNGDGRVTYEEFGGPPGAFRRADRSGDGSVTRGDR